VIHRAHQIDELLVNDVRDQLRRVEGLDDALAKRFGWELGPPQRSNRTSDVPVSESFRRRIATDNALDVQLYEYALELLANRGPVRP